MEAQEESRISERRGPEKRSRGERRIGKGLRISIRRLNEVPVEDERRVAVRRMGSVRRQEAVRRSRTRRNRERRTT